MRLRSLLVVLTATLLVPSVLTAPAAGSAQAPGAGPAFGDVAGDPHEPNILRMVEAGDVAGYPDGTYRPSVLVTRGQMATFLVRALTLPAAPSAGFTDTAGHPHEAAIDAVAAWGIAWGYEDGSYRPDAVVTRAQFARYLSRAIGLPPGPPAGFTDTAGHLHADAIDAVVAAGVAGGYPDRTFRPEDGVSRGQLATFLVRALYG